MQQGEMITCVKRIRCWESGEHLGRKMTFLFFECGEPLFVLDPDVDGVKTVVKEKKRKDSGEFPVEITSFEQVRETFVKVLSRNGIRWVKREHLCTPT